MDQQTTRRYLDCLSTPPLWQGTEVSPYEQIELSLTPLPPPTEVSFAPRRLGKLVEAFVFHQLQLSPSVNWLTDNLQIQDGKITVGEIDALYVANGTPIHLEVAYKFYLLDTLTTYSDPIARWIGPNRNDHLHYKLAKLHTRQFPLLYTPLARGYLNRYQLKPEQLQQSLCFKAQLFLPYGQQLDISPLNQDCVVGFHLPFRALATLEHYSFYIPSKLDWLLTPQPDISWQDYPEARQELAAVIKDKRSPLVWLKDTQGNLSKGFVTFW